MKKLLLIFIAAVLVCSFVACNMKDTSQNDTDTSDVNVTDGGGNETPNTSDVTVESITKLFYNDYSVQGYTPEQMEVILQNLEKAGIILKGEIKTVIHITKYGSVPGLCDWSWAYVYEFTDETDAVAFEENRRAFVNATEENGQCVRYGKIVVFGSAPNISLIPE